MLDELNASKPPVIIETIPTDQSVGSQATTPMNDITTQTKQQSRKVVRDSTTQTSPLDIVRDICIVRSLLSTRPPNVTPTSDERPIEDFDIIVIDSDDE